MLGNERAKQHGWYPRLGDTVRHGQPSGTKRGPSNRLAVTESTGRVDQPVDIKSDAPTGQAPSERGEHCRLARP